MAFIPKHKVPKHKIPTYARLVCDIRLHKVETHRSRLTVGGNLIDFPGDKSCATADLTTIKCLINSAISDINARFCTSDIRNFYLGTPLEHYEYMKLRLDIIPEEIISQYTHPSTAMSRRLYCEIKKGHVRSTPRRQDC